MKNITLLAFITLWATGAAARTGEELYNEDCAACHSSEVSVIPNVYGQQKAYLEKSLFTFQTEEREDEIMYQVMEDYTPEEIRSMAKYLSAENICKGNVEVDPFDGNPTIGKELAQVCASCHGDIGQGGTGPILSGQKTDYLIEAIKKFRDEIRTNEAIMNNTTKNLTNRDISDIAAFFNSTKNCE